MEKKKKQFSSGLARGEMTMTAEKNRKRLLAYFLAMILAAGILLSPHTLIHAAESRTASAEDGQMRGIWLCYKLPV